MSAIEPLYHLLKIDFRKFSKKEISFLEALLFLYVNQELKEVFRREHKDFFHLIRLNIKEEDVMLEANFVRLILRDIISQEDYNIKGVALYTNTPEDVVQEIMDGRNTNPSAAFLRKIIELHKTIRNDLYNSIMKRITVDVR